MDKRYFQHLDPHNDTFQTVTTLDFIDDSDPTFVMYYFADGSKCNKDYIGALNEQNVFGNKEFVEVSSPNNKWVFAIKPEQSNKKPETIRTQSGELVEIPTEEQWYGIDSKRTSEKDRYIVKVRPKYVEPKFIDTELMQNQDQKIEQEESFDFNINDNNSIEVAAEDVTKNNFETHIEKISYIDSNEFADTIKFRYNGQIYEMASSQFFANAIMSPQEKIIEKIVEKEVKKEVPEDHIEIGLDDTQKMLVDNMIDMSQKEHCDIEMCLTLNLPPLSVYKLIKSVYPKGMSAGFVNIIADRLKTVQLKQAVAKGLLAYYDEDSIIIDAETQPETINSSINEQEINQEEQIITEHTEKKKKRSIKNTK